MSEPKTRGSAAEQASQHWRVTTAGGVAQLLRFPGKVKEHEVRWAWPGAVAIEPTSERLPHKRYIPEREF
jgi:hypothetical protein